LTQSLQTQLENLQRSKKAYDKAYRDNEKALENFQKADADLHLSRAEVVVSSLSRPFPYLTRFPFQVEKQRANLSYKTQVCDTAKNEYAMQLQRTNELQRQHFRSGLPEVFRQLQELDEKRIKNIKNFIRSSVDIERNVFPIINKCLDGILKAADIINEKEVSVVVVSSSSLLC
jgi:SNF2 family DNA or RNA helicase